MSEMVILHDTRLNGTAPFSDLVITVNQTDSLGATFIRIKNYALSQTEPITLEIMCHGFETHNDTVGQQSLEKSFGGGGLQLCNENLRLNNVTQTSELAGYIDKIWVYACGVANTRPGYAGSYFDGQRLFKQMSQNTGAIIYAADVTQWYFRKPLPNACSDIIDFRRFEGNLWQFSPDGLSMIVESNQTKAW